MVDEMASVIFFDYLFFLIFTMRGQGYDTSANTTKICTVACPQHPSYEGLV